MIKIPPRLQGMLATASVHQKRAGLWIVKYAALCVIFLAFYIPSQKQETLTASNIHSLKEQIQDIKKISTSLLTPEEQESTEKRLEDFEKKLVPVSKAADLVDWISEEAEKNHLHLVQIYADSPISIRSDEGRELEIHGVKILRLPVSFRVESDYKSFTNFLKALRDDPRQDFTVELISLKKTSPDSDSLQCDVTLGVIAK